MTQTQTKAIKDLKRGNVIQLSSGNCAIVIRSFRDCLFEGDVWTVEHSQGQDTSSGCDLVAMGVEQ